MCEELTNNSGNISLTKPKNCARFVTRGLSLAPSLTTPAMLGVFLCVSKKKKELLVLVGQPYCRPYGQRPVLGWILCFNKHKILAFFGLVQICTVSYCSVLYCSVPLHRRAPHKLCREAGNITRQSRMGLKATIFSLIVIPNQLCTTQIINQCLSSSTLKQQQTSSMDTKKESCMLVSRALLN